MNIDLKYSTTVLANSVVSMLDEVKEECQKSGRITPGTT